MITTDRLHTALFWILIIQCCIISVSIAAGSLLLALTVFIIVVLTAREKKLIVTKNSLDIAFVGYIIVELLSAFLSEQPIDALKNAKRLFLLAIVYGVSISFTSKYRIHLALRIIASTIALLSLVEIVLYYYTGINRLNVFQSYMTAGGLKMIVSLLLIPFLLDKQSNKKDRILFSAAFLPIVLALVLTNTRSAWLGFIAGIIVMIVLHYKKLLYVLAAIIILFFTIAPEQQIERAKSIIDLSHPNNVGRVKMWTTGLEMWKDKPIFGYGDIDLYSSYSRYKTPDVDEPAGHLHNIYIHLLVTLGIVGFVVVLFLFYSIVRVQYLIFLRNRGDALIQNVALGAIAIFSGFLVNGLFEWNFGDHEIMVFVWFSVGLSLAVNNISEAGKI